jgi:hypothetical protein
MVLNPGSTSIVPAGFVQHKLTPQRVIPIADVDYMDWEFDEPSDDDDNEVRVFVSISEEERAIIKRYGYHHEPLEKDVTLFDSLDMQHLEQAQADELQGADPTSHAFLRMEHKQQLEWAQEQKIDITIIDYLAAPYRKRCANRFEATLTERKMNGRLMEFKKSLTLIVASDRFYGDLKARREQWKRETLLGGRAPEELDYRKFRQPKEHRIISTSVKSFAVPTNMPVRLSSSFAANGSR